MYLTFPEILNFYLPYQTTQFQNHSEMSYYTPVSVLWQHRCSAAGFRSLFSVSYDVTCAIVQNSCICLSQMPLPTVVFL